jgi:hypothetical protein
MILPVKAHRFQLADWVNGTRHVCDLTYVPWAKMGFCLSPAKPAFQCRITQNKPGNVLLTLIQNISPAGLNERQKGVFREGYTLCHLSGII